MSYCIEYTSGVSKKYPMKTKQKIKKQTVIAIVSVVTVALLCLPVVRESVKQLLMPGDPVITEAAFISMVEQLGAGESVYDAVTVFCKEIIQGAAS